MARQGLRQAEEGRVNPYTPIRRLAQDLLAEVQGMVAEVTLLELQAAGVRVVDADPGSAAPVDTREGAPARKRGRPRKVEAPPQSHWIPAHANSPDPDGADLLASPALASSLQGNTNGTRVKKVYPWERQ